MTCRLQNGLNHVGGCCFPLGSGNTDGCQLFLRMVKPYGRNQRQRVTGAGNTDHRDGGRHFYRCLHQKSRRSLFCNLLRIGMTVGDGSPDTDEQVIFPCLPGIIGNPFYFFLQAALQHLCLQAVQKFFQFFHFPLPSSAGAPACICTSAGYPADAT